MKPGPAERIERRLRLLSPGAKIVLDSLALREARMSFSRLLVEDPLQAYRVLLEYTRGDRRQARHFLLTLLRGIGVGVEEAAEAVAALERGDPGPLRRLLGTR